MFEETLGRNPGTRRKPGATLCPKLAVPPSRYTHPRPAASELPSGSPAGVRVILHPRQTCRRIAAQRRVLPRAT